MKLVKAILLIVVILSALNIVNIGTYIQEGYSFNKIRKEVKNLSNENRKIEIALSESLNIYDLENTLASNYNFEKITRVDYIRIIRNTVAER